MRKTGRRPPARQEWSAWLRVRRLGTGIQSRGTELPPGRPVEAVALHPPRAAKECASIIATCPAAVDMWQVSDPRFDRAPSPCTGHEGRSSAQERPPGFV